MIADLWDEYARLQRELNRTSDVRTGLGLEAAMTALLDKIANGESCAPNQVDNLIVNRTSKERRRSAILNRNRDTLSQQAPPMSDAVSRIYLRECIEVCGPADFFVLLRQAIGYSFREIALDTGANQNTLKTRAFRARQVLFADAA